MGHATRRRAIDRGSNPGLLSRRLKSTAVLLLCGAGVSWAEKTYEEQLGRLGAGEISVAKERGRDGVLQMSLREAIPPQLCDLSATHPLPCEVDIGRDIRQRIAYWMVIPAEEPVRAASSYHAYAVSSPVGRFEMRVETNVIATRVPTGETGIPVLFTFDPHNTRELSAPLHEAFHVAETKGILNVRQREELALLRSTYRQHYERFIELFKEFAEGTYVMRARTELYGVIQGLAFPDRLGEALWRPDHLSPQSFFDRGQRQTLRRAGLDIPGVCTIHYASERLRIVLQDCPISQVVKTWNDRWPGCGRLPPDSVDPNRELDLDLTMPASSEAEAGRAAFRFLKAVVEVEYTGS